MSIQDDKILAKQEEIDDVKKHRTPCTGSENTCMIVQFYKQEKQIEADKSAESPVVELGSKQEGDYISIPAHDSNSIER